MTPEDFERRVIETPDLKLTWLYWNVLLPETTGLACWMLFILPALREFSTHETPNTKKL